MSLLDHLGSSLVVHLYEYWLSAGDAAALDNALGDAPTAAIRLRCRTSRWVLERQLVIDRMNESTHRHWRVVASTWFMNWTRYVNLCSINLSPTSPGPVDNAELIGRDANELRRDLRPNEDYVLLPESIGEMLDDVYGRAPYPLHRTVVNGAINLYPFRVEMYRCKADPRHVPRVHYFAADVHMDVVKRTCMLAGCLQAYQKFRFWYRPTYLPHRQIRIYTAWRLLDQDVSLLSSVVGAAHGLDLLMEVQTDNNTWPFVSRDEFQTGDLLQCDGIVGIVIIKTSDHLLVQTISGPGQVLKVGESEYATRLCAWDDVSDVQFRQIAECSNNIRLVIAATDQLRDLQEQMSGLETKIDECGASLKLYQGAFDVEVDPVNGPGTGPLSTIAQCLDLERELEETLANVRQRRTQLSKWMNRKEDIPCVICHENPKGVACVPCGHVLCCEPCKETFRQQTTRCSLCRAPYQKLIRVFW